MSDAHHKTLDAEEKPRTRFLCTHCHSTDLEIHRHPTYCFRCRACGGGTPINLPCRKCAKQTRVRKNNGTYSAVCVTCNHEEVFFVEEHN